MIVKNNTKKIIITSLLITFLAVFFWQESRIPALTEKSQMGMRTQIESIAFDVILPIQESYHLVKRIAYTSVNWAYTNWKGMTFGMLLAAGFLTLIRLLTLKPSNNVFLNTLKGAFIGAPLGVCVNCSTPIMQGLHRSGVRLEMVLATLMSSPTLNIIVLTMSFSLLPFELAVIKLGAVCLFIFLVIPYLVRRYPLSNSKDAPENGLDNLDNLDELNKKDAANKFLLADDSVCDIGAPEQTISWLAILTEVLTTYAKNLGFIIKIALPFMLLAGVLGSAMIEAVPLGDLQSLQPTLTNILIVAFIGTFLPVPIAMDVLLVAILTSVGFATNLSAILLFTLGIFSVYPFLVIWRDISKEMAKGLFISVMLMGITAGLVAEKYEDYQAKQISQGFSQVYGQGIDIQALINEQCSKVNAQSDNNETINNCQASYTLYQLSLTKSDAICHQFDNKRFKQFCLSKHQLLQTQEQAITQAKPALCEKINNQGAANACQKNVITQLINMGAEITLCHQLNNKEDIQGCKTEGAITHLRKYNDKQACQVFDRGAAQLRCEQTMTLIAHVKSSNFDDCLLLGNSYNQNSCRLIIAKQHINKGEAIDVCHTLYTDKDIKTCEDAYYTKHGLFNRDSALCLKTNDTVERQHCLQSVVNSSINHEISQQQLNANSALLSDITRSSSINPNNTNNESNYSKAPALETPTLELIDFIDKSIPNGINIQTYEHQLPSNPLLTASSKTQFSKHALTDFGINTLPNTSFLELKTPFLMGRGIASGDVNNDHWPDILFATKNGIMLYLNTGKGGFVYHSLTHIPPATIDTQLVTLVDINNDGWDDVYFTGYGANNYFILNDKQLFQTATASKLNNDGTNLTFATGFADIDGNGYLDFILGNWSFADTKNFMTNYSTNKLVMNNNMHFTAQNLPNEIKGETLSILFSDLNQDNTLDIYIANDVAKPDQIYLQTGNNEQSLLKLKPDSLITSSSFNTMSIDSGDVNNDLITDLFSVDMSFSGTSEQAYCDTVTHPIDKAQCDNVIESRHQLHLSNMSWCKTLAEPKDKEECSVAMLRDYAIKTKKAELCHQIPAHYPVQKEFCLNIVKTDELDESFPIFSEIAQEQSNKLLIGADRLPYKDKAKTYGVDKSFWSWNAKFADVDNDGWQDIYVGNGYDFGGDQKEVHSNIFYHNQRGQGFKNNTTDFGLSNFASTPAYTLIDLDLDGDLDIVTTELITRGSVYINHNTQQNNSISFSLNDSTGNHHGIGSKVIIHTKQGKQMREIKLSGGYISFDVPQAVFGVANETSITQVTVTWPNNTTTHIKTDFKVNQHYVISR
jgi:uncharacterized membrane protein YraQ (UPF0718 family)